MPSAAPVSSSETTITRHSRNGDSSGAFAGRGGRRMMPGSDGSNASTRPSVADSTRLIQRICVAVIGIAKPTRMAMMTATASPPFVGIVHEMTLRMLS